MKNNETVETLFEFAFERERSIASARDPNEFYIETKLDKAKLKDEILGRKFDLVILQGTPGCGKSEFIHSLVKDIQSKGAAGDYEIRHDATHVEGKRASAVDELKLFFSVFDNETLLKDIAAKSKKTIKAGDLGQLKEIIARKQPQITKTYVVGVNRGIMQRVFADPNYAELKRVCEKPYSDQSRIILIDLSTRDYTSPADSSSADSLCSKLIDKIVDVNRWEGAACNECEAKSYCPFLSNAQYLRGNSQNNPITFNLELLHLKKQCVLTFRDLLGILAHIIVGNKSYYHGNSNACEAVRQWVKKELWQRMSLLLIWHAAVSDKNLFGRFAKEIQGDNYGANKTFGRGPSRFFDKKTGLLSQFDPVVAKSDSLDEFAHAVYADSAAVIKGPQVQLLPLEQKLFDEIHGKDEKPGSLELFRCNPDQNNAKKSEQDMIVALSLSNYMKRRKYFRDFNNLNMSDKTEYLSIDLFKRYANRETGLNKKVQKIIKRGIVKSDRLDYDKTKPRLKITNQLVYADAYLELREDMFKVEVEVDIPVGATEYFVETALSNNMRVKVYFCKNPITPFTINLDMFEVFYRINEGYDPAYTGACSSAFITALKNAMMKNITYYDELRVVVAPRENEHKLTIEYDKASSKFIVEQ